jgi:hypothetical protein
MNEELIEKLRQLLTEVEQKIDHLVDNINGLLDWVPWGLGWAVDKFKDLWNKAMDKLGEFWDFIRPIMILIGRPWDISSAQTDWNTVGSNVSGEVVTATDGELSVDDNWTGTAAEQYKKALANQKAALTAIKTTFTDKIAPALAGMVSALYTFYVGVGVAIAALVIGILAATGEAVSILGLPAVPPTVLVAIVVAIGAILKTGFDLRSAAASANATLSTLKGEQTAFGHDNWPKATI